MPPGSYTFMPPPSEHSEKRLLRAAKHVSIHWFPINLEVLKALKLGFQNGSLDDAAIDPLLVLLKKDFALFTYVVKELHPVAEKKSVPPATRANPLELLRWAGVSGIKEILLRDEGLPVTHQLTMSEEFQSARFVETAIIASTAEVLSESKSLNPDMAFCHGVVREIGLNLIAWNYPSLYARVLKALTPRASIDEQLALELGFSPITLAMHILRPAMRGSKFDLDKLNDSWAVYDDLCVIGEALARANNPNSYPTALNDWQLAGDFITKTIGESGLDLIRTRAIEHATEYTRALPSVFESLNRLDPTEHINAHLRGSRALDNRYLKQCPPHVQAALRSLYTEMPRSSVNKQALDKLFKEVIPAAGFTGGCVFVVDPTTLALAPRTVIGQVQLRPLKRVALKTVPGSGSSALISETILSSAGSSADLAAAAFACTHPLLERSDSTAEDAVAGIYSCLGSKRRVGVLYLEVPEKKLNEVSSTALILYKALRQTLCDALLLE